MLDFFLYLLQVLEKYKLWLLLAVVFVALYRAWEWRDLLNSPKDYPDTLRDAQLLIKSEHWGTQYLRWLIRVMNRLTRWIGDHHRFPLLIIPSKTSRSEPLPENWADLRVNPPFTVQSYEFCLVLAFIYPIIAFFISWLIGGDGQLGGKPILAEAWYLKILFLVGTVISSSLFIWSLRLSGWRHTITVISAFAGAFAGTVAGAFAGTVAGAGAGTVAGVVAGVVAGAITVAAAGTAAAAAFGAMTIAFAVAVAFAVAGVFVFAVAFAFAWGIYKTYHWADKKNEKPLFWFSYSIIFISLSFALLTQIDDELTTIWMLFFLVLPFANAPLDWLSLGITRHLLRRLCVERGWQHGLILAMLDMMLALFFLAMICVMLVTVVSLANLFAIKSILDLTPVFASLRDTSEHASDFWVYFILLSTLLPTLVHFALAGGAMTRAVSQATRNLMAEKITTDGRWKRRAYTYVVVMPTLGMVGVPALLLTMLMWLLSEQGGKLGLWMLNRAEELNAVIMTLG